MFFLLFLFILSLHTQNIFSIIQSKPICTVYTQDSILKNKGKYPIFYVGKRQRYSTCSGAAWFHQGYLAVVNFLGEKVTTYLFDSQTHTCEMLQEFSSKDGADLNSAENLIISPDGSLLAVSCGGKTKSRVNIYDIDLDTHIINPKPIFCLRTRDLTHGIRFTTDGNFLAAVGFDREREICVYKIKRSNGNVELVPTCIQKNVIKDLFPKGVDFTKDNRFMIVGYTLTAAHEAKLSKRSLVVVYAFDVLKGVIKKPVCMMDSAGLYLPDDLALIKNDRFLVLPNQGNDTLTVYPFDPKTGKIVDDYELIKNPEAQLSFPHGIGVSQDGDYLAVSNYGDDKFTIYRIS